MRARARVKGNVVPIRTAGQPDPSASTSQRIGTAGTDALCLEMPIRVMGFRLTTGPNGEITKGDSFEEDTSTMLLFARGAVIRLGEPVTRGQDVLLVNKRTNKYVHSRIKNLRTSPEVKSYAEIEFTHSVPDFWGISFPKEPLQVAGETAAPPPQAWPSADSRLESREAAPAKAMAAAAGAVDAGTSMLPSQREVSADFGSGAPTPLAEWDDAAAPAPPFFPPVPPAESAPVPSMLDRVQPPPRMVRFVNLESLIIPEPRSRRVRLAGVAAAALCALIVGYRYLWPESTQLPAVAQDFASVAGDLGRTENAEAAIAAPAGRTQKSSGNTSASVAGAVNSPAAPNSEPGSSVTAAVPEVTPVEPPKRLVVLVSKMNLPIQTVTLGRREAPEISPAQGAAPMGAAEQLAGKTPAGTASLLADSELQAPPPPEPPSASENAFRSGEALVPARVVSSVQPTYPLLAKQAHIEGSVVIEAQIDAAGNVTGTKVISGPQALRQAAVSALVRWKFAPARLRDWPTASTYVVTLRFVLH